MDTETMIIMLGVALPILIGFILVVVAIRLSASKKAGSEDDPETTAAGTPLMRSAPPTVGASAPRPVGPAASVPRTTAAIPGTMARGPGATARGPGATARGSRATARASGASAREQKPVALLYSAFPDRSLRTCPYCGCENAAAVRVCDACGELI